MLFTIDLFCYLFRAFQCALICEDSWERGDDLSWNHSVSLEGGLRGWVRTCVVLRWIINLSLMLRKPRSPVIRRARFISGQIQTKERVVLLLLWIRFYMIHVFAPWVSLVLRTRLIPWIVKVLKSSPHQLWWDWEYHLGH